MKKALARWLLQVLVALDQLVTAIFGGWADETVSSYLHRLERAQKPAGLVLRPLVDAIACRWPFNEPDHCATSYQRERERAQCPPELRPDTPRGLPQP